MNNTINCPACNEGITRGQLFRTLTLMSFSCPHCRARVRPENNSFGIWWLVLAGLVGGVAGILIAMMPRFVDEGTSLTPAYVLLVLFMLGAVLVIKAGASQSLIKNGRLKK